MTKIITERRKAAHARNSVFSFLGSPVPRAELVISVVSFVVLLGLWWMVAHLEWIPKQFLASPLAVVEALYRLFTQFHFIDDVGISVARVWSAFGIAAAMAIPLGILMSSFRVVRAMIEPVIDFIRYLPVPALVPLTVIWLGVGELSKITLLWMGTFFQLVLLIADDAKRVPREYVEIGRTVGARPFQLLKDIILPSMAPSMVDNLRITLGWCWTYLIVAEIVAADSGIGHVIWYMRRFVKTPEVLGGILVIGLIGLATDQAIRFAHRKYFAYLR